jgi:hypothetical protein
MEREFAAAIGRQACMRADGEASRFEPFAAKDECRDFGFVALVPHDR